MKKYDGLEAYDKTLLNEAKQRIMVVYNYHYGAPNSRSTVKKLETIIRKIDCLIKDCPI